MKWMIMPLARYADFSGRSRRLEYWMFALFIVMVMMALFVPMAFSASGVRDANETLPMSGIWIVFMAIFGVGIIIPSIAVQVRRLHDQDMSGWWVLLGFIPYIGGLVMLVLMLIPGTKGGNRFGADPKDDYAAIFG